MLVTPSGMLMRVKSLQPINASAPMDVTLSGILMLVKPLYPPKTPSPMDVTLYIFPLIRTFSGMAIESVLL